MSAEKPIPRRPELDPEKRWFEIVKELINVKGELERAQSKLEEANADRERLEREATLNSVTGLPNRRGIKQYVERLRREFARRGGGDHKIAIIYGDLKGFKLVNEQHGDQAGNTVLSKVGEILTGSVRPEDLVANPYGDTFVLFLPTERKKAAEAVVHRIAEKLSETPIKIHGNRGETDIYAQIYLNSKIVPVDSDFESFLNDLSQKKFEGKRKT